MSEGRSAGVTISYVGHNTLALSVDGVRLLTDPMLRMRFQILRRHSAPPDLHVVEDLDAILISHLHLDHANPRSLRLLPPDTPLLVPTGAGRILRRYHFRRLTELAPGESVSVGEVTVTATPARHDGRRYPWGHKAGGRGLHDPGLQEALLRRRHRPVRRIGRPEAAASTSLCFPSGGGG